MLTWMEAIEFARDLVRHVFLLNLIVWEERYFSCYRTERPAYTKSIEQMVRFATLPHFHYWSNAWKDELEELDADCFGYDEFFWLCGTRNLHWASERPTTDLKFLSNCIAISFLGIECFREKDILGPYYAVMAIVEYLEDLYNSDNLPPALADR